MRLNVRTALTSGTAWLVGAGSSIAVGLLALSLIGGGLGTHGTAPLTSEKPAPVAADADSSGPATWPPAAGGTSQSPRPSRSNPAYTSPDKVLRSEGGFVVARCTDGRAYLVSWTPEQGYRTHDVRRGPGSSASVEFESARQHIQLNVTCEGGAPRARTSQETEDDHDS